MFHAEITWNTFYDIKYGKPYFTIFFRSFNVALLKYRHSLKSRDSFEPLLRFKTIKKKNREKRATWKRGGKMFEARYDLILMRRRNETRWWKSVKETERTTILVELRFWFSALEAHFHRFSIFSLPFFLLFFFRKSHTDWMDAGRATSASSRNSRNLSHGGELAGQATSERKKRIDVPIHYVPSPGLDSGGSGNTCAKISLCCFFPLLRPIPSLETLLIGMTRQTWIFKGISCFFSFFLGNGLPVKLLTRPLFNFARISISIFKAGWEEKVWSKPIYGLM